MSIYDLGKTAIGADVQAATTDADNLRMMFGMTPTDPTRIRQRALAALDSEFGSAPKNVNTYSQMAARSVELGDRELAKTFQDLASSSATTTKNMAEAIKPSKFQLDAVANRFKSIYGTGDIGQQFGKIALGNENFDLASEGTKDFFTSTLKNEAQGFSNWLGSMGLSKADMQQILTNAETFDNYLGLYAQSGGATSQGIADLIKASTVPVNSTLIKSKTPQQPEKKEESFYDWLGSYF